MSVVHVVNLALSVVSVRMFIYKHHLVMRKLVEE